MKILVVSQYFYPENFRINELCFELAKTGHDVTVLTGYPNYPEGVIYEGYRDKSRKQEVINGVKVIRVNMRPRGKGAVNLFLNYVSYAVKAGIKAFFIKEKFDVSFVFEVSPITQILPAWIYKCKKRTPIIVNCQDIWPEVIKVYGINETSMVFGIVKKFSAWLYNRADVILNSSPGFGSYLNKICNVPFEKMKYLPNFAENFYLEFKTDKLKEKEKKRFLFAGNIGKAQNLDILIDALTLIPEEEKSKVVFEILGDGSYLKNLKENVEKNKLEDYFVFHGRKPVDLLKGYYENADGFILTLEKNSLISLTVPSKLQGYMGAGKPIIASIDGGAADIIRDASCGICVNAGDPNGLAKAIISILHDDVLFENMGKNGRDYFINNFTLKIYIDKLNDLMEKMI